MLDTWQPNMRKLVLFNETFMKLGILEDLEVRKFYTIREKYSVMFLEKVRHCMIKRMKLGKMI